MEVSRPSQRKMISVGSWTESGTGTDVRSNTGPREPSARGECRAAKGQARPTRGAEAPGAGEAAARGHHPRSTCVTKGAPATASATPLRRRGERKASEAERKCEKAPHDPSLRPEREVSEGGLRVVQ